MNIEPLFIIVLFFLAFVLFFGVLFFDETRFVAVNLCIDSCKGQGYGYYDVVVNDLNNFSNDYDCFCDTTKVIFE